jgi:hypothetical protein
VPQRTVDLTGISVGDTLVWDGSKFVPGPRSAPPIVGATLDDLGTPSYNGATGKLVLGTWPDVHVETLTWILADQQWVGGREYVVMSMGDTWAMDPDGHTLAQMRSPNWVRPYAGIDYGKPAHTYLSSDYVVGTDTTMNVNAATQFTSAGQVNLLDATINYTGKTTNTLTGCSKASGTNGTVHGDASNGTPVSQGEVGGWGTIVKPLPHAGALVAAGLVPQERVAGFMNGSADNYSMSIRPWWFEANNNDTITAPPTIASGGLGGGTILTGPAGPLGIANRANERPFATRLGGWQDWTATLPSKDLLWCAIYCQIPALAVDWGEFYAGTVRVRWVSP